ncbi:MAG: type II secretion system protein GspG [Bdellovibrionales bacterium]
MKFIRGKIGVPKWVLAILVLLAIPGVIFLCVAVNLSIFGIREPKQPYKATRIVLAETMKAIQFFYKDCKRLPTTMSELVATPPPAECKEVQSYLRRLPMDGWGNQVILTLHEKTVVLTSTGADGKEGGELANMDIEEKWTANE